MTTLNYAQGVRAPGVRIGIAATSGTFLVVASTMVMTLALDSTPIKEFLLQMPAFWRRPALFGGVSLTAIAWPLLHIRLMRAGIRRQGRALLVGDALALVALACAIFLLCDFFLGMGGSVRSAAALTYLALPGGVAAASVAIISLTSGDLAHPGRAAPACESAEGSAWCGLLENICMTSSVIAIAALALATWEPVLRDASEASYGLAPFSVRLVYSLARMLGEGADDSTSVACLIVLAMVLPVPSFLARLRDPRRTFHRPSHLWERLSPAHLLLGLVLTAGSAAVFINAGWWIIGRK